MVVWNVGLWQIGGGTLAVATLRWKLSAAVTNHSHRSTSVTSQQTVSKAAITLLYVYCTLSPFAFPELEWKRCVQASQLFPKPHKIVMADVTGQKIYLISP